MSFLMNLSILALPHMYFYRFLQLLKTKFWVILCKNLILNSYIRTQQCITLQYSIILKLKTKNYVVKYGIHFFTGAK